LDPGSSQDLKFNRRKARLTTLFFYSGLVAATLVAVILEKLDLSHIESDDVRQMDSVKYMSQLREVGKAVGTKQVNVKGHFLHFL